MFKRIWLLALAADVADAEKSKAQPYARGRLFEHPTWPQIKERRFEMRARVPIVALSVAVVLLIAGVAAGSPYVYGYDPAKAVGNGGDMYMELAQNPFPLSSGPYAGKIEYFFDLYTTGGAMYMANIVGLDNSKIANSQTARPGGGTCNTQRWGDPDGQYDLWPTATGRILDLWSKDVNGTLGSATGFDFWRTSYDDGAGGWTDSGLGYAGSSTDNPHSYAEYVEYHGFEYDIWKAELTGPGQPVHWFYTMFGITPSVDVIYIPGESIGIWSAPAAGGLVLTLRVVYDEEIDPATIGWDKGSATAQFDILGDFTVVPEPATLVLDIKPGSDPNSVNLKSMGLLPVVVYGTDELDVAEIDLDTLLLNGVGPRLMPDGTWHVSFEDVDGDLLLDLVMHFEMQALGIEPGMTDLTLTGLLMDGTGLQGADAIRIVPDFNGDLTVNATDLAIMNQSYGTAGVGFELGDANADGFVDATDLALLRLDLGWSESAFGEPIPEPASAVLFVLAGLTATARRRRRKR